MDSLPKDLLLEYNNDTLTTVRKQHNFEKKEDMDTAIDALEEWIRKQNHFTKKEYPRNYLERLIILRKGSVERAKMHMEKLCTLRTVVPHFFEHHDVRADCVPHTNGIFTHAFLPKLTPEHHRIYLAVLNNTKLSPKFFTSMFTMSVMFAEYVLAHDYCDGYILVTDLRNFNIVDIVKEMNIVEFRQIVAVIMEGFALRIKGIHLLTTSTTIEVLIKLMKQMFSAKIANRIFVHKNLDSLREVVPKEVLPIEYGGEEKHLKTIYENWLDVLSTKDFVEYMKEMNAARTNENLRLNERDREQYMGVAGTFRTFSVD